MNEASRPSFGGPDSDGVSFELFPQHPRAAAAVLSLLKGGARVSIENSCCPLRGHRVYGVKRRE